MGGEGGSKGITHSLIGFFGLFSRKLLLSSFEFFLYSVISTRVFIDDAYR